MTTTVISAITDVFDSIGAWIVGAVQDLMPMFYNPTDGLTFLGSLAVCGLAFSVSFLLIGVIQRFLHFGG